MSASIKTIPAMIGCFVLGIAASVGCILLGVMLGFHGMHNRVGLQVGFLLSSITACFVVGGVILARYGKRVEAGSALRIVLGVVYALLSLCGIALLTFMGLFVFNG